MCEISEKLKLCTCNSVDNILNYWIYYKNESRNNETIIGEVVAPYNFQKESAIQTSSQLIKMLNQQNCFDFEINHFENDQLLIQIEIKQGVIKKYYFKYKLGRWHSMEAGNLYRWNGVEFLKGNILF